MRKFLFKPMGTKKDQDPTMDRIGSKKPSSSRRRLTIAILLVAVVLVAALWPHSLLPHNPQFGDPNNRFIPPAFLEGGSSEFLLGTDSLGRDVLSTMIAGTRYTLMIVVSAGVIALIVGTILGLLSGYYRGAIDVLVMRLVDIQLSFPVLVLVLAVVAAFGSSIPVLIVVLGLAGWAPYARLTRGLVLSLRSRGYILAVETWGVRGSRILFRHLLPNAASPILVYFTFSLAMLVLLESSLAFLGLGVQPPLASWGGFISDSRQYLSSGWWASAVPGLAILFTVVAFNNLGDALRDSIDSSASNIG